MRLTIIKDDNKIVVDGIPKIIDISDIQPPNFHALQWEGPQDGTGGDGEIEFTGKPKPVNEEITDLGDYYQYYLLWVNTPLQVDPSPLDYLTNP